MDRIVVELEDIYGTSTPHPLDYICAPSEHYDGVVAWNELKTDFGSFHIIDADWIDPFSYAVFGGYDDCHLLGEGWCLHTYKVPAVDPEVILEFRRGVILAKTNQAQSVPDGFVDGESGDGGTPSESDSGDEAFGTGPDEEGPDPTDDHHAGGLA